MERGGLLLKGPRERGPLASHLFSYRKAKAVRRKTAAGRDPVLGTKLLVRVEDKRSPDSITQVQLKLNFNPPGVGRL